MIRLSAFAGALAETAYPHDSCWPVMVQLQEIVNVYAAMFVAAA